LCEGLHIVQTGVVSHPVYARSLVRPQVL
jgi:transcriptional regulator of NAD metabolism